jgi:hypothetical protein
MDPHGRSHEPRIADGMNSSAAERQKASAPDMEATADETCHA